MDMCIWKTLELCDLGTKCYGCPKFMSQFKGKGKELMTEYITDTQIAENIDSTHEKFRQLFEQHKEKNLV